MDKKTIFSKTILFIFIMIFVVTFKSIFGDENTLVGVTTITATLMFLQRDLTLSPLKNTFRIIILNLFMGIASIIATSNMWLGIPVNFITLFIISYYLCYNLKNPMYLPFSLQYLFLLANPITINLVPKRLSALVAGAVIIMLAQVIANKNKIYKSGNKILINICTNILEKIKCLKQKDVCDTYDKYIKSDLDSFRSMVYDKRESDFYLTEEGRIKLNLSVALENISMLLDKKEDLHKVSFIIDKLELFLLEVKDVLENDNNSEKLSNEMKHLLVEYEEKNIDDFYSLQMLNSIILLCDTIGELRTLTKANLNIVKKVGEKPINFKNGLTDLTLFKNKSLKLCYAIRIGIAIAIGTFIMDYFKFEEGRWIIFTLLSLITPVYEASKTKTKDRIIATLIGSIIILILFGIFKDSTSRTVIVMINGYIASYITKYRYSTITTTVAAIGSAALVGNVQELTIERILFVFLGMILAILINKFVFPYKLEDSNKDLSNMYKNVTKEMIKEIYNLANGNKESNTIKNLFIVTSFIENKKMLNNQISENKVDKNLIQHQRMLFTNIYELYMWIKKGNINSEYVQEILLSIKELINYENGSMKSKLEIINEYIRESDDLKTKITLSGILIILKEIEEIRILNLKAQI